MPLVSLLKSQDYERYLLSLFLPASCREAAWAVLAVNAELEAIPGKVKEPLAGAMRLAWWRERIDDLYEGKPPRNHVMLQALAPVLQAYPLPREAWYKLLEMYGGLIEQADATPDVTSLLCLLASLQGEAGEEEAWKSLGRAYGRARALPEENSAEMIKELEALLAKSPTQKQEGELKSALEKVVRALCKLHINNKKTAEKQRIRGKKHRIAGIFPWRLYMYMLLTK